ncbi:hypothetical protein J2Z44_002265 [Clostridium punense]|uniref:DUF2922 domain-containing protein n=1 Tax=Clostridium punense TaxID=1054297 RepID=A0ABS4K750_9CLOT|nr:MULTISPECIES: DUF2922 domain-containing protein [Clostridium]EQB90227.1 hypothetical protein M918_01130 [Clostridium sp. BL8]MBP2022444.1 hypothetical protein [Clostridium punense]
MSKDLVMGFTDVKGSKVTLRLKNVKDGVTEQEISTAMDAVVNSKLFQGKNGELKDKDYATIVETNKTKYDAI